MHKTFNLIIQGLAEKRLGQIRAPAWGCAAPHPKSAAPGHFANRDRRLNRYRPGQAGDVW